MLGSGVALWEDMQGVLAALRDGSSTRASTAASQEGRDNPEDQFVPITRQGPCQGPHEDNCRR